ncbi:MULTISPECIES: HD-GYP domain-containing protein [unclassified Nocardiopsis]|uniref:HD-GYP domain-containing protein n=1 Tax=unclassified Nocardiopsis TaxID=2649073 RepID=UPI001357BBEF|nr:MULTISPECIES: HD-GYP domain-containing protein [unclassified Nocardiopsis]
MLIGPYAGLDLRTLALIAILFVVAESISTAVLTGVKAGISPSSAVSLAAVVLVGPVGAAVVGFASCLSIRRQNLVKRVFNGAQFALAAYAAGHVYLLLGGTVGEPAREDFPAIVFPYVAAVLTHSLVNSVLIAVLMWTLGAVRSDGPRSRFHWRPLVAVELSSMGYQMLGLAIAAVWGGVGLVAPLLVLLPLFIARWTFAQQLNETRAHEATLATLCQAVETKDYYTRGHCMRVAEAAAMIARELGMPAERVQKIRYAGMLHDIGKLGVPTKVLQKTGRLTDEEYAAIKLHPTRGYEIVREISFLDEALAGIRHHHERLDGRGYPMGLVGMEIPESARVISVADVFDCLTSTRSYRQAWSVEDAIAELRACAGTQFDPRMVEALVRAVEREGWETPDIVEPPGGCYGSEAAEESAARAAASAEGAGEAELPAADGHAEQEPAASAEAVPGGRDR